MKTGSLLIQILIGLIITISSVSAQTYTLVDSLSTGCTGTFFTVGLTGRPYMMQKIYATSSYTLGKIAFKVRKNNSPVMNYRIEVRSHNVATDYPNAVLAFSDSVNAATTIPVSLGWVEYELTTPIVITLGDSIWSGYACGATDGTNYIYWCSLASDANTRAARSADGSTWAQQSTNDAGIRLYSVNSVSQSNTYNSRNKRTGRNTR